MMFSCTKMVSPDAIPSSLKYLVNMNKYKFNSTKEIIGKFADDVFSFSLLFPFWLFLILKQSTAFSVDFAITKVSYICSAF